MSDVSKIVKGCVQNKEKYKTKLYKEYWRIIISICKRYIYDKSSAEDAFQEAFIAIFKSIHTFNPEKGNLEAWLKGVTIKIVFKFNREHSKMKFSFEEQDNIVSDTEILLDDTLEANDLFSLLEELPYSKKVIFNLYAIEGYKHQEIAHKLGITEGTSKSQYFKAKKMLQELYIEKYT